MLSRICHLKGLQTTKLIRQLKSPIIHFSICNADAPKVDSNSAQRNEVSIPRIQRLEYNPPCVFGFVPKSWFDFFYSKTGVTGGYTLLFNTSVYLFSKEIIVCGPEFCSLLSFIALIIIVQKVVPLRQYIEKWQQECVKELDGFQEGKKNSIKQDIQLIRENILIAETIVSMLPEAKRENVYLQLEAAYRLYLRDVHLAVLNVLNYNLEKSLIENFFQKKNLYNWVLHEVETSITPEIKQVALQKAISDLKALGTSGHK